MLMEKSTSMNIFQYWKSVEFSQIENRLRKCFYLLTSRLKLFVTKNPKQFSLFNCRDGDMVLSKEEVTDEMRRLQGVDKAFKAMDLNK